MSTYTQKALKELVKSGAAEDITQYSFERMREFLRNNDLETVGVSRGIYGVTGALLKDHTNGELYAITARNSALFQAL